MNLLDGNPHANNSNRTPKSSINSAAAQISCTLASFAISGYRPVMRYATIQLAIILAALSTNSYAGTARVVDGDTIKIGNTRYRINGIDALEAGQKCAKANGKFWRCGKAATSAMATLIDGHDVKCTTHTNDGYGRKIATCLVNGRDIGAEMVRRGLAWAFVKYSDNTCCTAQILTRCTKTSHCPDATTRRVGGKRIFATVPWNP